MDGGSTQKRRGGAATEHGLKLAKAQAPVRVAVTGRTIGLPLFELVELLARKRTLARIDAAAAKLTQEAQIGPSGR
jgi:glutamyl/glutaminyl-tRNA synthetase